MTTSALNQLAKITDIHEDATQEMRKNILNALGYSVETEKKAEKTLKELLDAPFLEMISPVCILRKDRTSSINIHFPKGQDSFKWTLQEENESEYSGEVYINETELLETREINGVVYEKRCFELPVSPELGYHDFCVITSEGKEAKTKLIYTPEKCYFHLEENERCWGVPVQLFSLKSENNQGIGDFTDLGNFGKMLAKNKAGMLGLGPVHAMFPNVPEEASPYAPSSRTFYNHIYIDVTNVPDFKNSKKAKKLYNSADFQEKLTKIRNAPYIDYTTVTEIKTAILKKLYESFLETEFKQTPELIEISNRGKAFHQFCIDGGSELDDFAVFQTLSEHFSREKTAPYNWKEWVAEYQDFNSKKVKTFAAEHADRIDFYKYLQWETERQLKEASEHCKDMSIGLYMDLAVGVSSTSAEVWSDPELFIKKMLVGVPPFAHIHGQNWKLAALNPVTLKKRAYLPFIKMLRNSMKYAGCLRLDHVFQLRRLYIFPDDQTPNQGAFVGYPAEDLMAIVALESHRNKCIIVGEDVGFDPKNFREEAKDFGFMRCRVMHDLRKNRVFCNSEEYEKDAVVMSSTHDCSSLSRLWKNSYAHEGELIGLFDKQGLREIAYESGILDRTELNSVLERTGAWEAVGGKPVADPAHDTEEMPEKLIQAVATYLAKAPSFGMLMPLCDMFEMDKSVNIPGTMQKHTSMSKNVNFRASKKDVLYPNWRLKDAISIEKIEQQQIFKDIVEIINKERK